MSTWVDRWGKPFADYELRFIESDHWHDRDSAIGILDFNREHFGMQDAQAVSCGTCGGLFTEHLHHLRAHRRLCGWGNGAPAVAAPIGEEPG